MSFLLKHFFDPDLDRGKLKPQQQDDGSVNHYELNIVQNVKAGTLIAQWVELESGDAGAVEERFLFDEKIFPAGRGTGLKISVPDMLFAAVDGYVLYEEGKIVVRRNLTLPGDVDFHTGNLDFVGNLIIGGSIRAGFSVQGREVTVQGPIEGAQVEASQTLNCRGGIKGGKEAHLEAGETINTTFCEFAMLKAGRDILVKGALMHSEVYAGRRLAVGGRLTGGTYYSHDYIYIGEQLGGGLDTDTALILGYDPSLLYQDGQYNKRIKKLHEQIRTYEKILSKGDGHKVETEAKLESAISEIGLVKRLKAKLWEGIYSSERIGDCKVLVTGVVKPGVEISIGSAYLKVNDFLEDVYFYYENNEVKIGAAAKKLKR